jgi:predicted ATPase
VQFDPQNHIWMDVDEFELKAVRTDVASLQQAVSLYRGDFLEGFYDDWIISERYRFESLYLDALARLMILYEAGKDYLSALATALRLLSRDALREDAYQITMRAYCHLGQRKAALEQYERCREILLKELGAEPMVETRDLFLSILKGTSEVEPLPDIFPIQAQPAGPVGHDPLDVIATVRLIGREQETVFLEDCWRTAQAGNSILALIGGEGGVGKTSLVEDFSNRFRWQGLRVLWGRCYEFERILPYQPISDAMRMASLTLSNNEVAGFPDWVQREIARLVPELLDHLGMRKAPSEMNRKTADDLAPKLLFAPGSDPEQTLLFSGLTYFLAKLSVQGALLIVLEDLHWASESTLQLLHHLVRNLSGCPVLIVGTFRSDVVGPRHPLRTLIRQLVQEGLAKQLELSCLSPAAIETITREMSGVGDSVMSLAKRLYRETEGNPFFLMEIIKALFEADHIRLKEGAWQGDFDRISKMEFPLPASMYEAVQARVQRLPENVQEGLYLAAVLGREFSYEALNAALGKGEEATLEVLDELLRHRLVEDKTGPGESDFAFSHHKIQEIIYQALPRHRCLRLHAHVGAAMETVYAAEIESKAGELAHHFEQACRLDKLLCGRAIQYLLKAGQRAAQQFAYLEATRYYQRGLDLLPAQPDSKARVQQEIDLQLGLAIPLTMMKGYTSPEASRIFDRVRDLCTSLDATPALFTALSGLCRYYGLSGQHEAHKQLSEQILAIARKSGETNQLVTAYRGMASYLLGAGQLLEAREFYEKGLALYDPSLHLTLASRFGHDPALTFLAYLSTVLWQLGYPKQAQENTRRLSSLVTSFLHIPSRVIGNVQLAVQTSIQSNPQATLAYAEEAIHLSQLHGMSNWVSFATALQGWALFKQGNVDAIRMASDGIDCWQSYGILHLVPYLLSLKAECLLQLKQAAEGLHAIRTAIDLAQNGTDRNWLADLYRIQGLLLSENGADSKIVEASFQTSIDTARRQSARMIQLRTTRDLAKVWRDLGWSQLAHQALSEIYNQFTEGFDMVELQSASSLLRELSSCSKYAPHQ